LRAAETVERQLWRLLGTFCRLAGFDDMLSGRIINLQVRGRLFDGEALVRFEQFHELSPLVLLYRDVASLLANFFL
jgi:hypothetical protein